MKPSRTWSGRPSAGVTTTSFDPGVPIGVTHSTLVGESTVTPVQSTPAICTVVPAPQLVPLPVIATRVPPLVAPLLGSRTNAS